MLKGILLQFLAGVSRGSVLFLLASGLSLIFGVNRVLNFAHGSLYLLGMYISYSIVAKAFQAVPFGFWIGLALVPLSVAAIGTMVELIFFRRIYEKEHLMQLVLAFGLVYIMGDVMRFFWGVYAKTVDKPSELTGAVAVAGAKVPIYNLFIIAIGIAVYFALRIIIYKTRFGSLLRAIASDSDMTRALGVRVSLILTVVFALASFLAGLAGTLNAPVGAASLGMDAEICILAFIIVIIGGVGSVKGTAVAALTVGIVEAFGIMFVSQLTIVLIYLLMVMVLLIRPYGMFGKAIE